MSRGNVSIFHPPSSRRGRAAPGDITYPKPVGTGNEKVEPRYEGYMPSVTIRIINDNDQNAQAVLEEMIEKYLVNEDEFTDEGK